MSISRRNFLAATAVSSLTLITSNKASAQATQPATLPATQPVGRRGGRRGGGRGGQIAEPELPEWAAVRADYKVPQWLADAKFGIYAHWGVFCVPCWGNEWYPRNMYMRNAPEFAHHKEVWGDQSDFGYKEFIPMFKAKNWDPAEWASLYKAAGAKYAGPVAEHHDGFSMWDSQCNRWNSIAMGPNRNIVKELTDAVRKEGMKVFISMHHDYNVYFTTRPAGYFTIDKAFDTGDPKNRDFYGNYSSKEEAYAVWQNKTMEVIDKFMPDQLYFDGWLRDVPQPIRLKIAQHFYSQAKQMGKEVTVTYKSNGMPENTAYNDIERGGLADIGATPWQTDDTIGGPGWCNVEGFKVKPFGDLLRILIDNVSKNGNLLLNCAPRQDGTYADEQKAILASFGKWLGTNGEAIYASRPWKKFGEGSLLLGGSTRGQQTAQAAPSGSDFRFTTQGQTLYAIALAWPGTEAVVKSLAIGGDKPAGKVDKVEMLGNDGPLEFKQDDAGLHVAMPAKKPGDVAYSLKISGSGLV